MGAFDEFLSRNLQYVATGAPAPATAMPVHRVFLVTCLDPRVEPAGFLGVTTGDAVVLRNPGGRVSEATIADIALISFMGEVLGVEGEPMEVAIVHHTQCGMGLLADSGFRTAFAARSGISDAELAARAVTDPQVTVLEDVSTLLASPMVTARIVVSGHVLDLESGRVRTVAAAAAPTHLGHHG